jgi:hypothetical protein
MPSARDFAGAAEAFAGTRWRRHGRGRNGLDCGGLLVASLGAVGIVAPDTRDYDAAMPAPDMLWRMCREGGEEAPWSDQGEGRVGICSWREGGEARHIVIMLASRRIVHVDASLRCVTVVPAGWLEGRLIAVFRARGLEYGQPW